MPAPGMVQYQESQQLKGASTRRGGGITKKGVAPCVQTLATKNFDEAVKVPFADSGRHEWLLGSLKLS